MAKLELDLSSNELEELSTASFKEQDKAQEIKKPGGRPKSANPADKTVFLSSDELAFLDEMGYLTRTNRMQYLRSLIREKMKTFNN